MELDSHEVFFLVNMFAELKYSMLMVLGFISSGSPSTWRINPSIVMCRFINRKRMMMLKNRMMMRMVMRMMKTVMRMMMMMRMRMMTRMRILVRV